jgi:hypothetical protein
MLIRNFTSLSAASPLFSPGSRGNDSVGMGHLLVKFTRFDTDFDFVILLILKELS